MQTVRQMASGLVYAVVSLLLVIGSIALSLAQSQTPPPAASPLPAIATSTYTRVPGRRPTQSLPPAASLVAGTLLPTMTPGATTTSATSTPPTSAVGATSVPTRIRATACGPYPGWIRSYVVQPGDTLYRIAILHGISVDILRRANCKSGTVIYAGERLWVPFVLPPPTQLTIIPTFDTPTSEVTPTSSPTPTPTATP